MADNAGTLLPLTIMRRVIATRMSESLATAAQYTLTREVSADGLMDVAGEYKQKGQAIGVTDILVKLCAEALAKHPMLNATLREDGVFLHPCVNIGVAVALEQGLLVPVVHNADALSLAGIAARTKELIPKARKGKLSSAEMSGGTFTISNLGTNGIDVFTPVINLPEVAILGVGRVREIAVREADGIGWARVMILSLTVDHRVVDGSVGAAFLETMACMLSDIYNTKEDL